MNQQLITLLQAVTALFFLTWHVSVNAQSQRLMVPSYFECQRNLVTSWTGEIVKYQRLSDTINLTIFTDADTVENISITFKNLEQLQEQFYLNNKAFEGTNWQKIESSPAQLHNKMRATIWLCECPTVKPLINWQPEI